jgi:AcrR family transcriptional regulator
LTRLTREQSQAVTRQKLLDSARELFARGGYGGTSIDAICEHAGYSKGAFYPHFPSKEAIFLDILEQHGTSHQCVGRVARWIDLNRKCNRADGALGGGTISR